MLRDNFYRNHGFDTYLQGRLNYFFGQRNSLDALVDRYQIHGYDRNYHGALLDSKILAEVYLSMTGGQTSIGFSQEISQPGNTISKSKEKKVYMVNVSQEESNQHLNYLKSIRE